MGSPLLTPPRPSLDTPWLPLLQRQPAIRGTWKHLSHILTLSGVAESLGSHCGVECPRPTHPCKAPLGPEAQPQRHWDCWITALVHRDCLPGDGCQAADGGWHSLPSQEPAGPKGLLPSPAPRGTTLSPLPLVLPPEWTLASTATPAGPPSYIRPLEVPWVTSLLNVPPSGPSAHSVKCTLTPRCPPVLPSPPPLG